MHPVLGSNETSWIRSITDSAALMTLDLIKIRLWLSDAWHCNPSWEVQIGGDLWFSGFSLISQLLSLAAPPTCVFQHSNCPCTFPREPPTCSPPAAPLKWRASFHRVPPSCPLLLPQPLLVPLHTHTRMHAGLLVQTGEADVISLHFDSPGQSIA